MSLFIPSRNISIDPDKKSIVFITNRIFSGSHNHVYGFGDILIKHFKDLGTHNVIIIGNEKADYVRDQENLFYFSGVNFAKIAENFHRLKDDENAIEHNQSFITKEFSMFKDLNAEKIIILGDINFVLQLTVYDTRKVEGYDFKEKLNEYFDYTGDSEVILQNIDEVNKKVVGKFNGVSNLLAFSMYIKNIFSNLARYLFEMSEDFDKVYNFIIDPSFYTPFFTYNHIPIMNYYFADDKRGTRNFTKFPIAELQHLVYEKSLKKTVDLFDMFTTTEKTKDFFFMGSILQSKGNRQLTWKLFLNELDLDPEKNSLYVPLVMNGVRLTNSAGITKKRTLTAQEKLPEIVDQIKTHKLHKGDILPTEITDTIQNYKYGLILRCVSINDSLNFRIIKYLSQDILPFFDFFYDPEYLQIPKEFQDKLVVNSHLDIMEKVDYYNSNDQERTKLLNAMKKHFCIDNFKYDLNKFFVKESK